MLGRERGQPGLFEIVSLRCGCLRGAFEIVYRTWSSSSGVLASRRERQVGLQVRASRLLYDGDKMKAAVAHGYPNDVVEYLRAGVDVPYAPLFAGNHVHVPDLTQHDIRQTGTGRVVSGRGGVPRSAPHSAH